MREETKKQLVWLFVIAFWTLGFFFSRWSNPPAFAKEIGRSISVPLSGDAWLPLVYFPLTVVASFVLAQLFFGGGIIFMFFRGVWDSTVFSRLEAIVAETNLISIQYGQLWTMFYYLMILGCNLPLCLWAAQLGASQSLKVLERLQGKLVRPSEEVRWKMLMLIIASIVLAIPSSLAISYA
ncbi:MAG: hypothetical protein QXU01_01405 [Candidatus Hadarchaeales archaeon]